MTATAGNLLKDDPPTTTPFEVVDEVGLLRLRHYPPERRSGGAPVLLVYSLIKRPYILDLLPERSVVRSFLQEGFSVYLTDWLPPGPGDVMRGLDAYVNGDLAHAVACIQARERVEQVSLVGCCFGGLLAVIYAALHGSGVRQLVPFATPFDMQPAVWHGMADCIASVYGNAPAWLIRAGLNALIPSRLNLPLYLAQDLGEPELARSTWTSPTPLQLAIQRWMDSDVPFAGRAFCEIMRDAYAAGQLKDGRLEIGGRRVLLRDIRCPVLNIAGERDLLVPPGSTAGLVDAVGSREARNLVFPSGHLGLMVSRAAHRDLWPGIARWLRGDRDTAVA